MPDLVLNLSLFFTFPGLISNDLPPAFGFPSIGINGNVQDRLVLFVEFGGISYKFGEESISILNSNLGFGTVIRRYQFALGFTGTTAGISKFNIEDQSYTATFFRVGYRMGKLGIGLNLPVYMLASDKKFSVLPIPLIYVSISDKR